MDLTTLSSLRAHRTLKTVVKRKFVICLGNPFVTSCVSDVQNCGKMQIFNLSERPSAQKVIVGHYDSNNSKTIAYDAYKRSSSQYPREFSHLIQVLFQEAKSIPLAVVQIKKAINWDWICSGNQTAFTMLCLKHLDQAEQSQFANFLTQQRIRFYFPKKNVIWIDLRGIDSNILVKLMNYAEVPIPTSNKQGAFSVTLQGTLALSNPSSSCSSWRISTDTPAFG